jgi:CBS domain-containing protein
MTQLLARDVMTMDVLAVSQDMTLEEVARFLVEHEISGAPVVDPRGRLLGVVSLADLVRAGSEEERAGGVARHSDARRAPEALTLDLLEEPEPPEEQVEELSDEELAEEEPRRVADVMSTRVLSVDGATPITEVARMMVQARFHRVLITDNGKLVGLVSSMDLVRLVADRPATVVA